MRYLSFVLSFALWAGSVMAIEHFSLPWKNHAIPGMEYKSSDHPNGIFVIHHWYYGCGWCHEHESSVIDLANEYLSEERVQILDVGLPDSDNNFKKWIADHLPPYPVLEDKGRLLWRGLGVQAVSTTSIVDCRGNIRLQKVGTWDKYVKMEIHDTINAMLGESCDSFNFKDN